MEIEITKVSKYIKGSIDNGDTHIELGLMNRKEAKDLLDTLERAAQDIEYHLGTTRGGKPEIE